MTKEILIKSAIRTLINEQVKQGSWGYALEEDSAYEVSWKDVLKWLEQQPCEDVEVIQVSKGALKSRQGRFVIYDVDWLKKNFYLEEKIYGQPKQPKRGKWIPHIVNDKYESVDRDVCSECGKRFYQIAETGCVWNYCPNCGAKMESEDKGKNKGK